MGEEKQNEKRKNKIKINKTHVQNGSGVTAVK